jgi:hypothetical protein
LRGVGGRRGGGRNRSKETKKMRKLTLTAVGSALAVALWATAPFAQPAPSAFTVDTVLAANPFGELPIDPATIDVANIGAFLGTLTAEQRLELDQRCAVVSANTATYDMATVTFCMAVVAAAVTLPAAP